MPLGGPFGYGGFNLDIDSVARKSSSEAKRKASDAQARVRYLEANLSRTFLICEALWELLRDRAKFTDEDLNNKLYEIDMRDGQLDGKNQRQVVECPKCNRKVSPRHQACIYCGEIIDDSVFTMM